MIKDGRKGAADGRREQLKGAVDHVVEIGRRKKRQQLFQVDGSTVTPRRPGCPEWAGRPSCAGRVARGHSCSACHATRKISRHSKTEPIQCRRERIVRMWRSTGTEWPAKQA